MGLDCSWQWWSLFCSWPEQNKDHHCQLQAKKLQLEIQWMKTRTTRSAGRGSREWTWVNFQNSNEGIVCYWMNCRWHWRHDKHKIRTHMQPAFTQKILITYVHRKSIIYKLQRRIFTDWVVKSEKHLGDLLCEGSTVYEYGSFMPQCINVYNLTSPYMHCTVMFRFLFNAKSFKSH